MTAQPDLLDYLDVDDGGTGQAAEIEDDLAALEARGPVTHIVTPDFSTLCREDYLEASDRGDHLAHSPHLDRRDRVEVPIKGRDYMGLAWTRIRWRNITCPWCRSLGFVYYRHAVDTMHGRQAA